MYTGLETKSVHELKPLTATVSIHMSRLSCYSIVLELNCIMLLRRAVWCEHSQHRLSLRLTKGTLHGQENSLCPGLYHLLGVRYTLTSTPWHR